MTVRRRFTPQEYGLDIDFYVEKLLQRDYVDFAKGADGWNIDWEWYAVD